MTLDDKLNKLSPLRTLLYNDDVPKWLEPKPDFYKDCYLTCIYDIKCPYYEPYKNTNGCVRHREAVKKFNKSNQLKEY